MKSLAQVRLPYSEQQFYIDFLPYERRVIRRDGIRIFNIFYEALHGMTGKQDAQIQLILGLTGLASSENISIYIKNSVLGYCPSFK